MNDQTLELVAMVKENRAHAKRGGLVHSSYISHSYSRLFLQD